MASKTTTHQLLERAALTKPLEQVLTKTVAEYELGNLIKYTPFERGYVDANFRIQTSKGTYAVKIFSKQKKATEIKDYVGNLRTFSQNGIPIPKLLLTPTHQLLFSLSNVSLCVMEFFEGKTFLELPIAPKDIETIVRYMARIHKLKIQISPNYDLWGPALLLKEYPKKKPYLEPTDVPLVEVVVHEFAKINFLELKQAVIHGDMQREHVLKNEQNEYCILDLGCVDYAPIILDLGIFLAQFTIDSTPSQLNEFLKLTIRTYKQYNDLPAAEFKLLPLMMRATYASYLLAATYQVKALNDTSPQSRNWLRFARKGLQKKLPDKAAEFPV